MVRTLKIKSTQPQANFHALPHKYRAIFAGFGTGKSQTMADAALMDAVQHPQALIGIYEPTYDLVRLIAAPRMQQRLEENGIRFKYNKSENIIYTSTQGVGDFILRTLDNPERIIGYETLCAHIDELDTLPAEKAKAVWEKIIARNRQSFKGCDHLENRVSAYSTPEGYKFCYDRWVANTSDLYGYVQASTLSNPFLPDDYVTSLRESYPEQLIDAYINGEFVNLTSGTVYGSYQRQKHSTNEKTRNGEQLFIGMDFNVTKQAATVYVKRNGDEWHCVAELVDMFDTPDAISVIKSKWPNHPVIIYPDASGNNRKSVNASESDISLLRQAGFSIRVNNSNPAVKDRILATNKAFEAGKVFVNYNACPTVARCLEQQAYGKNGEPDKASGNDHQNDATTYPLAYELPIIKPLTTMKFTGF